MFLHEFAKVCLTFKVLYPQHQEIIKFYICSCLWLSGFCQLKLSITSRYARYNSAPLLNSLELLSHSRQMNKEFIITGPDAAQNLREGGGGKLYFEDLYVYILLHWEMFLAYMSAYCFLNSEKVKKSTFFARTYKKSGFWKVSCASARKFWNFILQGR